MISHYLIYYYWLRGFYLETVKGVFYCDVLNFCILRSVTFASVGTVLTYIFHKNYWTFSGLKICTQILLRMRFGKMTRICSKAVPLKFQVRSNIFKWILVKIYFHVIYVFYDESVSKLGVSDYLINKFTKMLCKSTVIILPFK